jgi:LmbE family N-acetylglucosaminyl deacetylase
MLPLLLGQATHRPLRILCLGAHSDDLEIGKPVFRKYA